MRYALSEVHFTDQGLCRAENQDSVFTYIDNNIAVFCVADGMGGHADGKCASSAIVTGIREWANDFYDEKYEGNFQIILNDFDRRLSEINSQIYQLYNKEKICGSTVVVLLIYQEYYAVFSLGDSRIYRKRGLSFAQLTRDDTWQNSNEAEGLTSIDIKRHDNYGKLMKAIGTQDSVILNYQTDKLKKGDIFFLCSDGVYRYCSQTVIRQNCRKHSMKMRLENIRNYVNSKGAPDNLTAILVQIGRQKDR